MKNIFTVLLCAVLSTMCVAAEEVVLATTTSAQDSGLLPHLTQIFMKETGISVKTLAVGTGQAFHIARRGDADVVLTHDEEQELRFMNEGYGATRRSVMYNDFIIVGPSDDPAHIRGQTAKEGMTRIAAANSPFVSRGDKSGTHGLELRLWKIAGIAAFDPSWYRSVGSGMGATLNVAASTDSYTLVDRATWLHFANRQNLAALVEGDHVLFNQYSVITLNTQKVSASNAHLGQRFADWLVSPATQAHINNFKIVGQKVYIPNARR